MRNSERRSEKVEPVVSTVALQITRRDILVGRDSRYREAGEIEVLVEIGQRQFEPGRRGRAQAVLVGWMIGTDDEGSQIADVIDGSPLQSSGARHRQGVEIGDQQPQRVRIGGEFGSP